MPFTFGQRVTAHIAGGLSALIFGLSGRHVRHACRWHFRGPLDDVLRSEDQVIVAAWHQDVLAFFHYLSMFTAFEKRRRFTMMSSRSFDGELTERILRVWGYEFVRGSAGKSGSRTALRGLLRALEKGRDVALIADGPGPPPYRMRKGPVFLARSTGVPLYVTRAWTRPQLILARTWFRMALPLPRSDVALFSAGPIDVSGSFEEARLRAERELVRLGEEADAHLYLRSKVRGGIPLRARAV
ncbi:MAG: lysophospholipid acyltransferase family protein [Planctomycetota bacterium]